jgi:hypothetical protein
MHPSARQSTELCWRVLHTRYALLADVCFRNLFCLSVLARACSSTPSLKGAYCIGSASAMHSPSGKSMEGYTWG